LIKNQLSIDDLNIEWIGSGLVEVRLNVDCGKQYWAIGRRLGEHARG
jgi:hypothetical protein